MTSNWKLFGLGALAMLAFAGNSILNRYALVDGHAGAWSFTLIRLLSGAIMLALLTRLQIRGGSWAGAASLLVYAAGFSFAYQALDAGLGALILFTAVQFTMMGRGVAKGERLGAFQWLGVVIAFAAMVWLLWPAHRISETVPEGGGVHEFGRYGLGRLFSYRARCVFASISDIRKLCAGGPNGPDIDYTYFSDFA